MSLPAVLSLTGCTDEQLREYVSRFDKSVQTAASAVRAKYSAVNDVRRIAYLTQVRLQPGTEIEVRHEVNGVKEPTGLVQYYSDEYVEARLLAFQALSSYTEGLALMAASNAPKEAEEALRVTGDRLTQLGKRLEALDTKSKPLAVTQLATPIANLVALATNHLLEYVKDRNLKDSLLASESHVRNLSRILIDDLNEINSVVEGAEWASILAKYRTLYNGNSQLLNGTYLDAGRAAVLKDIEGVAKRYADLGSSNPAILVQNVQLAHEQIIDYLNANNKKRSKEEFGKLLDADIRQFENDAQIVSSSSERLAASVRRRDGE